MFIHVSCTGLNSMSVWLGMHAFKIKLYHLYTMSDTQTANEPRNGGFLLIRPTYWGWLLTMNLFKSLFLVSYKSIYNGKGLLYVAFGQKSYVLASGLEHLLQTHGDSLSVCVCFICV